MKKVNIYTKGNQRKINSSWFTAKTHMKEIGDILKISEQNMYHVYFEKGSRTKLHYHNGNQILIATEGEGSLEIFKKKGIKNNNFTMDKIEKILLKKGDIVYIPSKTLHIHGSINKKKIFSHIAVNILPKKNAEYKTIWYESNFKDRAAEIIK